MIKIEAKLNLKDISLDYPSKDATVHALRGVSFDVVSGQSVSIIGPSGCGKSSLLSIACGLIQPTSGEAVLNGRVVTGPNRETALVLQDFGLLPWKNVIDNCALGLKVRGVGKGERYQSARHALSTVHLEGVEEAFPSELSGGMKQRLALARALALDCELLLLDEPMSALDALLREEMQDLLLALWKECGYTQIIVTHSIEEAALLGQRIFVMGGSPGTLIASIDNPHACDVSLRATREFQDMCNHLRTTLAGVAPDCEELIS